MHGKTLTTEEKLTQFWSVQLPRRLDPWAPKLADAMADGVWSAGWRGVAAYSPVAALAVGILTPMIWPRLGIGPGNPGWIGMGNVYSESLLFLLLVIAGAILSGPVGVMLLLGYIVGVLAGGSEVRYHFLDHPFRRGGSLLISYLLLAAPAVMIPVLSRRMAEEVPLAIRLPLLRVSAKAVLYGAACAMLIFLWCHAMIALIRPIFTWARSSPTIEAIWQVQHRWKWMAGVAFVIAVARPALEWLAAHRSPRADLVAQLQARRWTGVQRRGERWRGLPFAVRVGLASAVSTLLLAGVYNGWFDAFLVAAATAALGIWRVDLIRRLPAVWARTVRKIPVLIRFAGGAVVGYQLAKLVVKPQWETMLETNSFRPMLVGTLLTLMIFYVLFPSEQGLSAAKRERMETT